MTGPRPISRRTLDMCAQYERRMAAGEDRAKIIADLAAQHDVQRPAIWKVLRAGGAVSPYKRRKAGGQGRPVGGGTPGWTEERNKRAVKAASRAEQVVEAARKATAEPCGRCGTRADLGCRHQPPQGERPAHLDEEPQAKARHPNSLWGHKGNPAGPARQRMEANFRAMFGLPGRE